MLEPLCHPRQRVTGVANPTQEALEQKLKKLVCMHASDPALNDHAPALKKHLCPMRRRKRRKDMQAVRSSSQHVCGCYMPNMCCHIPPNQSDMRFHIERIGIRLPASRGERATMRENYGCCAQYGMHGIRLNVGLSQLLLS